jgi:hypothetical protein
VATPVPPEEAVLLTDDVVIYQSDPDATVERLAQLDSAFCPRGRVLVAAVGGEPRAALPLDGGPAVADPFHPTAELVALLGMRAAQLNGRPSRAPFAVLPIMLRRLRALSPGQSGSAGRSHTSRRVPAAAARVTLLY